MKKIYFTSITLLSLLFTISNCSKDEVEENTPQNPDYTQPSGSFIDGRDGQNYDWVKIGEQVWMAENLNYETPNSSWPYNDSGAGEIYGRLYLWDAAVDGCPTGWHLPNDDEWKKLEMEIGMSQEEADLIGWRGNDEGKKLKNESGWPDDDGVGNNSSGFFAIPGGYSYPDPDGIGTRYSSYATSGFWWTAWSHGNNLSAWYRSISSIRDDIKRDGIPKTYGLAVRCLKD